MGRGLTLYVIAHRCRCRRMRDRYCFIKRTLQFTTMNKDWWGILVEVCQRGSPQPLLLSQLPILPLATSAHLDLSIVTLYTSSKLADVVDAVPNRSWPRTVRNREKEKEREETITESQVQGEPPVTLSITYLLEIWPVPMKLTRERREIVLLSME